MYKVQKTKSILTKEDRKKLVKTTATILMITVSHLLLFTVPDALYYIDTANVVPDDVLFIMVTSQGWYISDSTFCTFSTFRLKTLSL